MTIQRFLKALRTTKSRTFSTLTTVATTHTTTGSPLYHWQSPSHRLLSVPLCKWIPPFQGMGPLFLSFPPWKLSQSATPLYLRGNAAVLRKVEAFNLKLIRKGIRSGYVSSGQLVLDRFRDKDLYEDRGGSVVVKEGFAESFLNLPNFISVARLVSGPFLGWMITNEMYSYAFVGLAVSGMTDWLDGYVARKMKINSVVGSYLDPLADKVLIGSVALAMVHMDLLHPGLVGLVLLRDAGLVGGAVYHRVSSLGWKWSSWYDFFNLDGTKPEKVEPLFISKVNTVFQLALVAAALLQPDFGTDDTQTCIKYLSWLVALTTVASTGAYGAKYWGNRSALLARKSLS